MPERGLNVCVVGGGIGGVNKLWGQLRTMLINSHNIPQYQIKINFQFEMGVMLERELFQIY